MISVVCVYNQRSILNNYMIKGLKAQTTSYELILVDNTTKRFHSAAQALNYGGKKASGKYIMFIHQDLLLRSEMALKNIEAIMDKLPHLGVIGIAGCIEDRPMLSNITGGIPPFQQGISITEPTRVQTLDECLIVVSKKIFKKRKFDEKTCDGWHLYAVDYCLDLESIRFHAYVLPIDAYHRGWWLRGRAQRLVIWDYHRILRKVLRKHRGQTDQIATSCGTWNTRHPPSSPQLIGSNIAIILWTLQTLRRVGPIQFAAKIAEFMSLRYGENLRSPRA